MIQVWIHLKAGGVIEFVCEDMDIILDYNDPQKIAAIQWKGATPNLAYLHLDNIAAIQSSPIKLEVSSD